MATSPRTAGSPKDKEANNITPKEFGERLDALGKHHTNLMKVASKVYSLGKSQRLQFPNGAVVGRKELRTLSSQFVKELKALKKNYTAHGKKKKRVVTPGGSAGFKNPIYVTQNMREFFQKANLGPSGVQEVQSGGVEITGSDGVKRRYAINPNSAPLNSLLSVGLNGITTRAIMTPLFTIYTYVNGMQQDPTNKQFLKSTPLMDQYFQDTYARLRAEPQRYQKIKGTKQDDLSKPIPPFDPNHFRYASIQSIVAENTHPADAKQQAKRPHLAMLGPQEKAALADPAVKARLEEEQQMVSGILAVYRAQKKAAEKAAGGKTRAKK